MEDSRKELYRSLVTEHSDMVTRLCLLRTGNYTDAEDCYQEVFLKLFKALEKGRLPEPKAWLIRVTVNQCNSLLRYRLRRPALRLEDIPEAGESMDSERALETLDAVMRLPARYREVIYLYYYEGLSAEETAAALGRKIPTVRSQLKRGRERLKIMLGEGEL
ncbi:MAG: RNA polymerase sigma factor [Ruminococcus sp.]|nr:RNA polymerase sigma factor [Ruminococcus sp.]